MSGGGANDGARKWDADEGCSVVRYRLELEKKKPLKFTNPANNAVETTSEEGGVASMGERM
jgi:hypothetical protein